MSEEYPLTAKIWKRDSTNEWVLELSGVIGETNFICRHTEPLTTPVEDVAGLPSHYALAADCERMREIIKDFIDHSTEENAEVTHRARLLIGYEL